MTVDELNKIKEVKSKNKFKSRTFWLTAVWMMMIPVAITAQVLLLDVELPVSTIVTFSGSITLLYIGGNKGENIANSIRTK